MNEGSTFVVVLVFILGQNVELSVHIQKKKTDEFKPWT